MLEEKEEKKDSYGFEEKNRRGGAGGKTLEQKREDNKLEVKFNTDVKAAITLIPDKEIHTFLTSKNPDALISLFVNPLSDPKSHKNILLYYKNFLKKLYPYQVNTALLAHKIYLMSDFFAASARAWLSLINAKCSVYSAMQQRYHSPLINEKNNFSKLKRAFFLVAKKYIQYILEQKAVALKANQVIQAHYICHILTEGVKFKKRFRGLSFTYQEFMKPNPDLLSCQKLTERYRDKLIKGFFDKTKINTILQEDIIVPLQQLLRREGIQEQFLVLEPENASSSEEEDTPRPHQPGQPLSFKELMEVIKYAPLACYCHFINSTKPNKASLSDWVTERPPSKETVTTLDQLSARLNQGKHGQDAMLYLTWAPPFEQERHQLTLDSPVEQGMHQLILTPLVEQEGHQLTLDKTTLGKGSHVIFPNFVVALRIRYARNIKTKQYEDMVVGVFLQKDNKLHPPLFNHQATINYPLFSRVALTVFKRLNTVLAQVQKNSPADIERVINYILRRLYDPSFVLQKAQFSKQEAMRCIEKLGDSDSYETKQLIRDIKRRYLRAKQPDNKKQSAGKRVLRVTTLNLRSITSRVASSGRDKKQSIKSKTCRLRRKTNTSRSDQKSRKPSVSRSPVSSKISMRISSLSALRRRKSSRLEPSTSRGSRTSVLSTQRSQSSSLSRSSFSHRASLTSQGSLSPSSRRTRRSSPQPSVLFSQSPVYKAEQKQASQHPRRVRNSSVIVKKLPLGRLLKKQNKKKGKAKKKKTPLFFTQRLPKRVGTGSPKKPYSKQKKHKNISTARSRTNAPKGIKKQPNF